MIQKVTEGLSGTFQSEGATRSAGEFCGTTDWFGVKEKWIVGRFL